MGVPIQDHERYFQNWIDHLKRCIHVRAGGEYFEGQRKVKWPHYANLRRTKASDITFGAPSYVYRESLI